MTESCPEYLHITTYLQGGAGRAVVDLATAQVERGKRTAVVASRSELPGFSHYPAYVRRLESAGVPLLLADSTFLRDPRASTAVVDAIVDAFQLGRLRLVHAHAGTPARIALMLSRRLQRSLSIVQTMHGWGTNKTASQAAEDLEVLRAVDRVIVTSAASRDEMARRGVQLEKMLTIPCGLPAIPPPAVADHPVAREIAARRVAGEHALLCVGSVNANKNQRLLLQALPALLTRRRLLVVFVGEGPDIPALQRASQELGIEAAVRFVGYQPDAASWMSGADLLVQPSRSEGQGLAVLEAFRGGLPVVASDIAAHRELIEDRRTGWLFATDDAASAAAAIDRALAEPPDVRRRIIAAAADVFQARYTIDSMVAAHEREYSSLLRG